MKRFDAYEIRHCGVFISATGAEYVEPINGVTGLSPDILPTCDFWSLYGHRTDEGVECIADRDEYYDIRELYFAITGNDCGEAEQDYFNLPISAAMPVGLLASLEALFDNCAMTHNVWGDGSNQKQAKEAIAAVKAFMTTAKEQL